MCCACAAEVHDVQSLANLLHPELVNYNRCGTPCEIVCFSHNVHIAGRKPRNVTTKHLERVGLWKIVFIEHPIIPLVVDPNRSLKSSLVSGTANEECRSRIRVSFWAVPHENPCHGAPRAQNEIPRALSRVHWKPTLLKKSPLQAHWSTAKTITRWTSGSVTRWIVPSSALVHHRAESLSESSSNKVSHASSTLLSSSLDALFSAPILSSNSFQRCFACTSELWRLSNPIVRTSNSIRQEFKVSLAASVYSSSFC